MVNSPVSTPRAGRQQQTAEMDKFNQRCDWWVMCIKSGIGSTWSERDIQKEAMVMAQKEWAPTGTTSSQTLPAPPPPPHNIGQRLSIGPMGRAFIPAAVRKTILAQITQLAPTSAPEPADLAPFWLQVESTIDSLDCQVSTYDLTVLDVLAIGPIVLGAIGWSQVNQSACTTWRSFRQEVEVVFGLHKDQLIEKFFAMVQNPEEPTAKFVLRIEAERKLRNLQAREVYHVFARRLPVHYQQALDQLRPSLRATSQRSPGWEDVVGIARDELTGALLIAPTAATPQGSSQVPYQPSAPATTPATTAPAAAQAAGRPTCDLCTRLGLGNPNHKRDFCFIDPKSRAYKPDVRAKRLSDAMKRGVKIPQDILDMAPMPSFNAVIPGPVADLTSALRMAGSLDEEYVEQIVEAVLDQEQGSIGGGLNSVTHLADGEVAEIIAAVGQEQPRRSLLDQLSEVGVAGTAAGQPEPPYPGRPLAERIAEIISEKVQNLVAPTSQPVAYDVSTNTRVNRRGLQKALGMPLDQQQQQPKAQGPKPVDLATIVSRLRVSYPVLTASKLDAGMRQLVLAELVEQCLVDNSSLVIPEGCRVQTVNAERFKTYRDQLSGLTPGNLQQVKANLRAQGFQFGAPAQQEQQGPLDTQMTEESADSPELREVAVQAVDMISALCKEIIPDILSAVVGKKQGEMLANVAPATPMPGWAQHLQDGRNVLKWDSSQTICQVGIGPALTYAIVDTGSCKTIISKGMCEQLGIKYQAANGGNCGTYAVPGTGATNYYHGAVRERLVLQFGEKVKFYITGLKVIDHPTNLMLLGADVMCGGRLSGMWNFDGIHQTTTPQGCTGRLVFSNHQGTEECPLVHVPVQAQAVNMVGMVGGPPLGGQYLRGGF